jgi:hypothetical protein
VLLKEQRLIRPSKTLAKRLGAGHVGPLLCSRCVAVLQQLQLQLAAKAADSSFLASKAALAEQERVVAAEGEEEGKWEGDWVIT